MKNWIQKHYFISAGVVILVGWLLFISAGASSGTCNKCQQISENIINLTTEELMSCPQKYENKIIRTSTILHHDSGQLFLGDEGAKLSSLVLAGIGKDFTSCYFTRRAITFNTGYRTWYDGSAQVTLIGKFGIIDDQMNFHSGINGLNMLCFEAVYSTENQSRLINHCLYTLTRTGRLIRLSLEP